MAKWNTAALKVVPQIREMAYKAPRLLVTNVTEFGPDSGRGKRGRKNNVEQENPRGDLYEELSKYYRPTTGYCMPQEVLSNCKHEYFRCAGDISLSHFSSVVRDLETHPEL